MAYITCWNNHMMWWYPPLWEDRIREPTGHRPRAKDICRSSQCSHAAAGKARSRVSRATARAAGQEEVPRAGWSGGSHRQSAAGHLRAGRWAPTGT